MREAKFERIDPRSWEIASRERLNSRFNQSLYRQDGYAALGIERVELWLLELVTPRRPSRRSP